MWHDVGCSDSEEKCFWELAADSAIDKAVIEQFFVIILGIF